MFQNDGTTHSEICQEIWKQWESCRAALASNEKVGAAVAVDIQIARIMEQQALCVVPQKKQTEEEKKLKQSILTQYAQVIQNLYYITCATFTFSTFVFVPLDTWCF